MAGSVAEVLAYFRHLSSIPRPSKHEEKAADWISQWAEERGFSVVRDALSNLVIRVPGTTSTSAQTIVLQAHLDMVCEATPDTSHDCLNDPIEVIETDGWLTANGTTLGADNGIAVAIAMALAEDTELQRPPLELLFTVDEETGLNGAKALRPDMLTGRRLINIDSEEEGSFTVGCAGGQDSTITLPIERQAPPPNGSFVSISIGGLPGGHSGVEINSAIANANIVLAQTLQRIMHRREIRLVTFTGGSAHNAIPRDATATIWTDGSVDIEESLIEDSLEEARRETGREFPGCTPKFTAQSVASGDLAPMSRASSQALINLLIALPHGVDRMTDGAVNLVETSNNLATVRTDSENATILTSQRSSIEARLRAITGRIGAVANLAGATIVNTEGYPAWEPDFDSSLLGVAGATYAELFDQEAAVDVIHAGLECGVIGSIYPDMDMISFGPTIEGAHSPSERLNIGSLDRTWRFCRALLERLAQ